MSLPSVEERLRAGDVLRMRLADGRRQFWFENPYQAVTDVQLYKAGKSVTIAEAYDSLFGWTGNSQTWFSISESSEAQAEDQPPAAHLP